MNELTVLCYSGYDVDGLSSVLPPRSFGEQVELLKERLGRADLAAASDGGGGRVRQAGLVGPLRVRGDECGDTLDVALIADVQYSNYTPHHNNSSQQHMSGGSKGMLQVYCSETV